MEFKLQPASHFGAGVRKPAMMMSVERCGRTCRRAILGLAALAALSGAPASGKDLGMKLAQLRGYSASGTHQCGSDKAHTCIVTGSGFTNCNDASITLQTRDCCPTSTAGGKSSGFILNYCIPDRPL
jgi:hypothetical protein